MRINLDRIKWSPVKPVRMQLSRRKGFDLQQTSQALNGLPAVVVARPSRWGNPYKVEPAFDQDGVKAPAITREVAVELFRQVWERQLAHASVRENLVSNLRGKNLACWCKPGEPCHADVLLALANREFAP